MNKEQLIKQITDKIVVTNPSEYVEQIGEEEYSLKRSFDLEDVLIAHDKNSLTSDVSLAVTSEGLFFDTSFYDTKDWKTQYLWQLGKPLHLQDEPTLRFINDILQ